MPKNEFNWGLTQNGGLAQPGLNLVCVHIYKGERERIDTDRVPIFISQPHCTVQSM